ncbi:MAG: HAD hydrolase family protein [Pseudomonadota bacterium]
MAPPHNALANIELLVLDVDGVLTDGQLLYGAEGEIGKSFNVKDGYGLRRLLTAGVHIAAIGGRRSDGALMRLSELGIEHIHLGCRDKVAVLTQLQQALKLNPDQTAVMGDDLPDLAMMALGAIRIAPADAVAALRDQTDWVTSLPGGRGAVREVCDALLAAREGR